MQQWHSLREKALMSTCCHSLALNSCNAVELELLLRFKKSVVKVNSICYEYIHATEILLCLLFWLLFSLRPC